MGRVGSALLLSLLACTMEARADNGTEPAWVAPPAALHGLWYRTDDTVLCDRFLAAADPWEHEGSVLIGALWIDDQVLHIWADYGEGDIHRVLHSVPVAPTQWQLEVSVGMDTWPDLVRDGSFPLWLSLADGVLVWHEQIPQGDTRAWQRCADLPRRPDY